MTAKMDLRRPARPKGGKARSPKPKITEAKDGELKTGSLAPQPAASLSIAAAIWRPGAKPAPQARSDRR